MIIVLLTVVVAAVLRVPVTDWHLAVLVPLEIVYAAVSWFAAARYLGRVSGDNRSDDVGWALKLFAPELLLCILVLGAKGLVVCVAGKLGDFGALHFGWGLPSVERRFYRRAFCATVAALAGFCLTVLSFLGETYTLAQVPPVFLSFVLAATAISIITTILGGELGKWYSRWILVVGFYILRAGQMGEMAQVVMPFSVTFFALYIGRFVADVVTYDGREAVWPI